MALLETFVQYFLGCLSAPVAKLCAAPLERAKLLCQLEAELVRQGRLSRPFGGSLVALSHVIATEGLPGLFRGQLTNVLRYFPAQALNIALRDVFKNLFNFGQKNYSPRFLGNLACGALAGATTLCLVHPFDLAFTVLAADVVDPEQSHSSHHFDGCMDVLRQTVKHSGFAGLYAGFGIGVLGIVVYRSAYFGFYDTLKPFIPRENSLATFALAWGLMISPGVLTYPLDTIRKRMMLAAATPMAYHSTMECVTTIWNEQGLLGFFAGLGHSILRTCAGEASLMLYDHIKNTVSKELL